MKKHTFTCRPKNCIYASRRIQAAEENFDVDEADFDDSITDAVDAVAEDLQDIQEDLEDIDEDDVEIKTNNNIADHYIAECEDCYGVFISAVSESDQDIKFVSGTCPICGKETDQYLKWIIKSV